MKVYCEMLSAITAIRRKGSRNRHGGAVKLLGICDRGFSLSYRGLWIQDSHAELSYVEEDLAF